jgi:EpsI family protein
VIPGPRWLAWGTAGLLLAGVALTSQVFDQRMLALRSPLAEAVPAEVGAYTGRDTEISADEIAVAGVTDYVMRLYEPADPRQAVAPWVSVYVGFYASQTQGKTIHSPKNCMPGSGWEALASRHVAVPVAGGAPVQVNRYLLVNDAQQVLVLYWYQGRGRVVASEYQAKWDLLRDAAVKRRSDEALVRVVVPVIDGDEERAHALALDVAQRLLPAVDGALPAA